MPDNRFLLHSNSHGAKSQKLAGFLFILHMQTRQVNAILTIMVAVHLLVL